MSVCNNGARIPSPQEAANGLTQPSASGTWHKPEEEAKTVEPNLVKKAHREILDHERKRRVELKCMELQEMMEEQGYSEEEIRQKVGTFRQMLMEKEGVLTREDQHGRQIIIENHYVVPGEESVTEYSMYGEGYTLECDCHSDWYQDDSGHRDYRTHRRLSNSGSPPPKKRKKKKSGHKRSRCDSSSPVRKDKKKKSGKKHKRDRSNSGTRKKRRHRSRSLKNKRKDKSKDRKRSHSGSPVRRTHRHSSCSSHSASPSSDYSTSKSPCRQSPKHRQDDHKPSSHRSSRSLSSSCTAHSRSATPHQNGHKSGSHNGHHNQGHGVTVEKNLDHLNSVSPSSKTHSKVETSPNHHKANNRNDIRSPRSISSGKGGRCSSDDKRRRHSRSPSSERQRGRSRGRTRMHKESSVNTESHTGYSSDSEGSIVSHTPGVEKTHGALTKKPTVKHHRGKQNSCSESSVKRTRQNFERRKSLARSTGNRGSSWSSSCSPSRSRSRDKRSARSRSRSLSPKKNLNREKDNETRARHNETEAARPRRRSRSYSPIRKRRRDSPSFMEPRRITSARKRPIPYYRPSPSSSSLSSYSHSRSRSRSYDSYSSYSRSRTRSRSPSHSRSPSYRSSSESAGF
ncbi:serine/arginine repetitive matrix protein 3 isoform X2 [Bufo gargarizans]|uniref:serine/arginine repetitive matrix protein 3 isoform X2 n=1 Tax=Bufo gargarizans TaxID=30331 RepID=UPI001CF22BB4|nr:serine/arginine repetitive matrix protein 3 isoform X2 [Bufo gargarizans]